MWQVIGRGRDSSESQDELVVRVGLVEGLRLGLEELVRLRLQ